MHNTDHLIGSAEAAELLGIDRATFNRWVLAGRITPAVEFPGKRGARLFERADVERIADGLTADKAASA